MIVVLQCHGVRGAPNGGAHQSTVPLFPRACAPTPVRCTAMKASGSLWCTLIFASRMAAQQASQKTCRTLRWVVRQFAQFASHDDDLLRKPLLLNLWHPSRPTAPASARRRTEPPDAPDSVLCQPLYLHISPIRSGGIHAKSATTGCRTPPPSHARLIQCNRHSRVAPPRMSARHAEVWITEPSARFTI